MTTVIRANRRRPREDLRAAVYEAAIGLFQARGFAATSVETIAAAAGVAKGTFFNFFPAKADVLKVYYSRVDAEVARLRAHLDPGNPEDALGRYGRAVEHVLRREGRLMMELLSLTLNDPDMRRIDEASGSLDGEEFAAFFAEARKLGTISVDVAPADAAAAVVDLWSGAMRAWLTSGGEASLAGLFEARIAILFKGLA